MQLSASNWRASRLGFTLIELLVCMAMVAVLATLVLTGMARTKESAKRAICMNNLHQIGLAVAVYYDDNHHIPESVGDNFARNPTVMLGQKRDGAHFYNLETMSQYIAGARITSDPNDLQLGGVWRCPANNKPTIEEWRLQMAGWKFISTPYTFYGRVDLWSHLASRPDDLTADELAPDRLVATDIFYVWWVGKTWTWNHGPRPQWNESKEVNTMYGLNRLYGDTRVEWKSARKIDFDNLTPSSPTIGSVNGYAGSTSFY
jgi:prepilin-type N-terminal cleavage/methylation domain-containing protein